MVPLLKWLKKVPPKEEGRVRRRVLPFSDPSESPRNRPDPAAAAPSRARSSHSMSSLLPLDANCLIGAHDDLVRRCRQHGPRTELPRIVAEKTNTPPVASLSAVRSTASPSRSSGHAPSRLFRFLRHGTTQGLLSHLCPTQTYSTTQTSQTSRQMSPFPTLEISLVFPLEFIFCSSFPTGESK